MACLCALLLSQSSKQARYDMGGGYSAPAVEPIPEKQATKSLSAGATAAAQAQREKQRRNRGLASSIMTNRIGAGGLAGMANGRTTLGS